MQVAVSPYHLTTREPAAVAALLLAERVVTMLPSPFGGGGSDRGRVEELTARIPKYLDFMQSWRWSIPLWNAGVVSARAGWGEGGGGRGGEDAVEDVRAVCAQIAGDERFSPLRPLMRPELFDTEEGYLEAVARDLLKGGPDPAITVPVAAGMDRFAIRHGMAVARSEATSVAQRAEERMGRRAFAVAVPVLLQASGERLLAAREALAEELAELRTALAAFVDPGAGLSADEMVQAQAELAVAARAYATAFAEVREELIAPPRPDEEEECRVVDGTVALTGMVLPGDAVLTSSMAAMRALAPALARGSGRTGGRTLPALGGRPGSDPLEGRDFLTLLVRPLGRTTPPARRR